MIQRTFERTAEVVPRENIYIATDHDDIKKHCEDKGMNVVMTSVKCLTGTDRVAEVAKHIEADIYINVQGDEPLIKPEDIKSIVDAALNNPSEVINGYAPIQESDYEKRTIPKVVVDQAGKLIYMSRAPIPGTKSGEFKKAWKQVCIYSFPQKALMDFAEINSKSTLEEIEDIEILRFLEKGFDVRMIEVIGDSIAVDTPEDAEQVRKVLGCEK